MPIHGITATYQPFSFQERLAPLQMMKEEYDKVNESLALYDEQANQYYQFLDDNSKAIVDQYKNTLSRVAGDMASSGLKAVNRNTLNSLRRVYANDILPIQQAAQTAGTMYAQIREMQMKDPTLMIQSIPTVSELRQNPMARPSLVSGAQLQSEGIKAALELPGVDYQSISRFLNGDASAIPDIDVAAQRIADAYGVSTDQAMGYITNGIMSGLGQRATSLYDAQQKADIEFANRMRLLNAQTGKESYLARLRANEQIRVAQEKAKLKTTTSSSSSKSGTRGSGTSYNRQMDGTVYVRGDQEYAYNGSFGTAQKDEAEAAEKKSKARGTSVYRLSDENKARALRYIGVDVPDDVSRDELEMLIEENESALLDYTYKEFVNDRRPKENEFKMSPKKVKRDVGVQEVDYDEDEDITLD